LTNRNEYLPFSWSSGYSDLQLEVVEDPLKYDEPAVYQVLKKLAAGSTKSPPSYISRSIRMFTAIRQVFRRAQHLDGHLYIRSRSDLAYSSNYVLDLLLLYSNHGLNSLISSYPCPSLCWNTVPDTYFEITPDIYKAFTKTISSLNVGDFARILRDYNYEPNAVLNCILRWSIFKNSRILFRDIYGQGIYLLRQNLYETLNANYGPHYLPLFQAMGVSFDYLKQLSFVEEASIQIRSCYQLFDYILSSNLKTWVKCKQSVLLSRIYNRHIRKTDYISHDSSLEDLLSILESR
jgi:hypothetical protein